MEINILNCGKVVFLIFAWIIILFNFIVISQTAKIAGELNLLEKKLSRDFKTLLNNLTPVIRRTREKNKRFSMFFDLKLTTPNDFLNSAVGLTKNYFDDLSSIEKFLLLVFAAKKLKPLVKK